MNQAAEYLRGFTKKNIMLSRSSPSSKNNKSNKERSRTSAGMRQQYFSIPTSALDTAPQERKKEEEKCNVK